MSQIKLNSALSLPRPLVCYFPVTIFTTNMYFLEMCKRPYKNWKVNTHGYNLYLPKAGRTPYPKWHKSFLNEAISEQRLPVKAHFNILASADNQEELKNIRNLCSAALIY